MLVNHCVKNPDKLVNYNIPKSFIINEYTFTLNNVNFHIPSLVKEVKNLPKKEKWKIKKQLKTFIATASSFLMLPLNSMANVSTNSNQINVNIPAMAEGMPPELLDLLIKLLITVVGSAVILAAILLVVAQVKKMFGKILGKKKETDEWTIEIVKALIQVLITVPLVFLLYFLAKFLFSGTNLWVNPF